MLVRADSWKHLTTQQRGAAERFGEALLACIKLKPTGDLTIASSSVAVPGQGAVGKFKTVFVRKSELPIQFDEALWNRLVFQMVGAKHASPDFNAIKEAKLSKLLTGALGKGFNAQEIKAL